MLQVNFSLKHGFEGVRIVAEDAGEEDIDLALWPVIRPLALQIEAQILKVAVGAAKTLKAAERQRDRVQG